MLFLFKNFIVINIFDILVGTKIKTGPENLFRTC